MRKPDAFWAKTAPHEGGLRVHPLACHALDVAAVAEVMLRQRPILLDRIAAGFRLPPEEALSLACFLIALHDIGKISRAFQSRVPELAPHWAEPFTGVPEQHWILSNDLMARHLSGDLKPVFAGWSNGAVVALVAPIAGHHGRPPPVEFGIMAQQVMAQRLANQIGPEFLPGARAFLAAMRALFAPSSPSPPGDEDACRLAALGWTLAGLTVLADWVGSNADFFPPAHAAGGDWSVDVASYWRDKARPGATSAVGSFGLAPARWAARPGWRTLMGEGASAPRPMQAAAETAVLPGGPTLFVIEDVTGAGKTEAALILAHRLIAAGRADAIYFAMPTMATANAMYERLAAVLNRLFEPGERPSIALAHGRRGLMKTYTETIGSMTVDDDETVAAYCSRWIADDRRKAFLADIGAGTIDQAFLAVLPSRHQSLRLHGLGRGVLVVDEAHACDAYMMKELTRLLTFQAGLGGSAIVLSATLPGATRRGLARAFAEGLDAPSGPRPSGQTYPLLTAVSAEGVREYPVAPAPHSIRRVDVSRLASVADAVAAAVAAARAGAAVAWVRNTVDDAIDAFRMLSLHGRSHPALRLDLFHARFAMGDRLDIETKVLHAYGRQSGRAERAGRILVATQVIEQSLDLDFDLLISDLAPVDLLIQRAGRLWRHPDLRPAESRPVPGPLLHVVSPDPDGNVGRRWPAPDLPGPGFIYSGALLWRSARIVFGRGVIDTPDGLRPMIEAVYGPDAPALPAALESGAYEAEGKDKAASGLAAAKLLDFAKGYRADGPWEEDQLALTRLQDESRPVRLARWTEGNLRPWRDADSDARGWALSEVNAQPRLLRAMPVHPPDIVDAIDTLRASWPRFERDVPILVVPPEGVQQAPGSLVYDARLGLVLQGEEERIGSGRMGAAVAV